MKDLKLVFSLVTGEVYTVEKDEVEKLDNYQVLLKRRFPTNCKKCFGRGYIGQRCVLTPDGAKPTEHFSFCTKCLSKCVDR